MKRTYKARLDWLQKNMSILHVPFNKTRKGKCIHVQEKYLSPWYLEWKLPVGSQPTHTWLQAKTLIEAIDAAMDQEAKR